ncbi:hypothetical protein N0V83_003621 [Neocucurbitaria cava]|uniref:Uncharacterized protein n=1 Tax=Neocucurbitaria cava TaxID=798079 RepID=A0A9W8YC60_9PLEO|nr:hypothetical protein N0V83_003621 [Neocucurbitaria cava]
MQAHHQHPQTKDDDILSYTAQQRFDAEYSPCHPLSCFHDLLCGHRIQVEYNSETCGINCARQKINKPFVCPECLIDGVRVEVALHGLDLRAPGEDVDMGGYQSTREDAIQKIADMKLKQLLAMGRRMCKMTTKLADPKLQFFHQFLIEEGFEGIVEDGNTDLTTATRYKRPNAAKGKSTRGPAWKHREPAQQDLEGEAEVTVTLGDVMEEFQAGTRQTELLKEERGDDTARIDSAMDGLVEQFYQTRVALPVEDEATRAVREAFELCELTGGVL